MGVEQPAEHTGKREYVVDLVREVRPAGGYDGCVFGRFHWVHLGVGGGQGENDTAVGHGADVGAGQQVRSRDPDEHVGIHQGVTQSPGETEPVGVLGQPQQLARDVLAATMDDPGPVGYHDVDDAGREQELNDGRPSRARARHDDTDLIDFLADHAKSVVQRGDNHDRSTVLVVVEDGD